MKDALEYGADAAKETVGEMLFEGISQAPFAVLLFEPKTKLLVWRNHAHAVISNSVGREAAGLPLCEAFPPSDGDTRAEARVAILSSIERITTNHAAEDIGPFRFDLKGADEIYREHHWQITMFPIVQDGAVVAVMQLYKDVTEDALAARIDGPHKCSAANIASIYHFNFDPDRETFTRSDDVDEMFGFVNGEAGPKATQFFDRIHQDDIEGVHAEIARVRAAGPGETAALDYRVRWPNGTERFLRTRAEMIIDPKDRSAKLVGTLVDVTDLETDRRLLGKALERRETLATEANHRIKNSLSIAASILRMQSRPIEAAEGISSKEALEVLRSAEARIRAVADVHDLMQMCQHGTSVSLCSLVERLVGYTRKSAELSGEEFRMTLPDRDADVSGDTAISLSLILNELITNALKYGLGDHDDTKIALAVSLGEGAASIYLTNRIVEKTRIGQIFSSHLGSRLVQQLADQLLATVTVEEKGDHYSVTFSMPLPCLPCTN